METKISFLTSALIKWLETTNLINLECIREIKVYSLPILDRWEYQH
jgi:hypothetical protein